MQQASRQPIGDATSRSCGSHWPPAGHVRPATGRVRASIHAVFVCSECGTPQQAGGFCPSDGTPLAPIGEDVLLGITIGAYRVARLLGIGGMGRVYKGVHPQIGSRVAIKVLSRECSDRKDLVDRFFSEARAVNLIRHESIVNVLDLAVLPDGRPYIIMEYLDGVPLASCIEHAIANRAPMPLGGLARLAAEVLDALGAAHAKGIVHRDLKPDNIYVSPSGRGKVLDFGIAKLTDASNAATRTGSLMGTPHYMSPEQASGRMVDARADIYGMGIILFECTTGVKPFMAESLFDLLRMHLEAPPPLPRSLRPEIPVELERVILTALAKQPDQRYPSAEAMSLALQQATVQLPPEQWAPITALGTRSGSHAWAPTPPQSWNRSATRVDPKNQSTVSAGQQIAPARGKSKKGVWLALAAFALVGGGITAAVLASGGSEPMQTASSDPPKPKPADIPAAKPVDKPVVEAKPAKPEPPVETDEPPAVGSAKAKAPKAKPKDDDDDEIDQAMKKAEHDAAQLLNQATDEMNKQMTAAFHPAGGTWFASHQLKLAGFDPKKADVGALIPWAIAEAKKVVPDAALFRIGIDGLYADGHADLSLPTLASSSGEIELRFVSPSRNKRDPKVPLGARYEYSCELRVEASMTGIEIRPITNSFACKDPPVPVPRCSPTAVWKKAIASKADLAGANAVGELNYYNNPVSHQVHWFFDIKDVFDEQYKDDC